MEARCGFLRQLHKFGDRPALLDADAQVSYRELADRMDEVGRALGVTRRLVLVAAANELASVVHYLGALAAGHVVLLCGPAERSWSPLAAHFDPDVVIRPDGAGGVTVDGRRPGTRHVLHPELALLLSTSGSTGSAKLVRLSAANLDANASSIAAFLGLRPDDRAVTSLPLSYCYGLSVLHSHLAVGAATVVTDLSVVDACFWDLAVAAGVTGLAGVPYTFDMLDRLGGPAGLDRLPTLRRVTQAGGRLAPAAVRRYAEAGAAAGWSMVVMYGQTEATARMAYLPPELAAAHPEAVGVPVPGGAFAIDGTGELVYTGPNVMLGYAHDPSDLALGRTVTELRTGDLARRTADGLIEIVGRCARRAKLFGLRLDLDDVTGRLADGGTTAACWADEAAGELHVVVETPEEPRRSTDTAALVSAMTGLPRRAVRVRVVRQLPRLDNGKPDLAALRADRPRLTAEPDDAPGRPLEVALHQLYRDALGRRDVTATSTFVGLGGDSLSYVELSVRLEELLGALPTDWPRRTLRDLAACADRPAADADGGTLARAARPSRLARTETSVLLRAVAVVAIVGSHANVFDDIGKLEGGAHLLLAVAGYNLARFGLHPGPRRSQVARLLRATARIALPSSLFIAVLVLTMDEHGVANILLLNSVLGPDEVGPPWEFWFLEALVQTMLLVTVLLSVPAVHRWNSRWPALLPGLVLLVGLVPRLGLVALPEGPSQVQSPEAVLWLFALGWLGAVATGFWGRLGVSAAALLAVPGFFDDPRRERLVLGGLLLLLWVPRLPCPRVVLRPAALLAAASLAIYLTHWQVFPHLQVEHPVAALLASLAVGVAVHLALPGVRRAAGRARAQASSRRRAAVSRTSPSSGSPVTRAWTSIPSMSAARTRAEVASVSSPSVARSPSSQTRATGLSSSLRAAAR